MSVTIEPFQLPDADFAERSVFEAAGGTPLHVYIFRTPDRVARRPAIVFVHGGGWSGGGPRQFFTHARYFASRGMVAFSVQYRTHAEPDDTTPVQALERVRAAYRWIRQHAEALGVDPAGIVVSGSSAGGHLAAALALLPEPVEPAPAAMVLFNPVTDTTLSGYRPERFAGMQPSLESLSLCEPSLITPQCPPTLICHPLADATVPFENSTRFRDLLVRAGVPCTLIAVEGAEHGYIYAGPADRQAARSIRDADEFLRGLGLLQGEPTVAFEEA